MEEWIKLNNSTIGRDRIARFLQYLSRFLWYRLQQDKLTNDIEKLKNLEYQLSTFRRLLRFGRFIESLYATLPLLDDKRISVRYVIVFSKIANSLFLMADHILWLGRADLCAVNTDKWNKVCNKYWLFSITMNLVRDFYEISQLILKHKASKDINNIDIIKVLIQTAKNVENNGIYVDTLRNSCDFFIPLTALGYIKLSPGTIGLLGTVSSLLGLWVLVNPKLKLSPS